MGSLNTPNPWAPYDSFKDCSQAICSIYCPQWCYIIFPPPPFDPPINNSGRHGTPLSPLIISVIAILASAFLLLTYYVMVSRYCRGRRVDRNPELGMNLDQMTQQEQQWQLAATGLDESVIESITVWKYKQGEGLVQGNDCAVCLSEFEDGENLRLLPKCSHAFHLLCIDTWLKSHSNCPLCRANIVSVNPPLPLLPAPIPETHSNAPSLEIPRLNDLIFVIDDDNQEIHLREEEEDEEVVSLAADHNDVSTNNNRIGQSGEEEDVPKLRRSISLGSVPCQRQLLLADKLRINENKNGLKDQNYGISIEIGSSIGEQSKSQSNRSTSLELISNPAAIKRSISTGRFAVTRHNRGKNSLFPN